MPRALAPTLLVAALLGGCGGGPVAEIAEIDLEPPYLPLPATEKAADRDVPSDAPVRTPEIGDEEGEVAAGAPTDAEVAAELRQAFKTTAKANIDLVDAASVDGRGFATTPPTAPSKVARIISAANQVAHRPYRYGGGHGAGAGEVWQDSAYDCSGSVSFALAAAGFLDGPLDSTRLATFGKPGPGKWVTIYANAGHAFMVVAGLRFDTSGRQETGSRWQPDARTVSGFTLRHPPGL